MPQPPTAARELRRGLAGYSLMVGAISAVTLGLGALLATRLGLLPDLLGDGGAPQALAAALALFVAITAVHTGAHTYFGWRFERGIRAAAAGDHRRAVRLLAPVERPGMSHYDPDGHAHRTLQSARRERASS